jgi:hypothetical protein
MGGGEDINSCDVAHYAARSIVLCYLLPGCRHGNGSTVAVQLCSLVAWTTLALPVNQYYVRVTISLPSTPLPPFPVSE